MSKINQYEPIKEYRFLFKIAGVESYKIKSVEIDGNILKFCYHQAENGLVFPDLPLDTAELIFLNTEGHRVSAIVFKLEHLVKTVYFKQKMDYTTAANLLTEIEFPFRSMEVLS